jgi:16S rRNA (cytidine1402-2'-O)-methyltransferase
VKNSVKKKNPSLDYPLLAQKLLEASGEDAASKSLTGGSLKAGLYVVATPIGHRGDITLRALTTLAQADVIACEDTRVSGALLNGYGIRKTLIPYHDHNADEKRPEILRRLQAGEAVALISDAGMPLIADPGYKLVRECRAEGYDVTVIPGANAALTGLAGSGLPTGPFYFAGFLPPKSKARRDAAGELAKLPATLVFYEAPQRLAETLKDFAAIMGVKREAAIARELTKLFEETRRGTLGELADYYAVNDVKGEIVIIVGPPNEHDAKPAHDLNGILEDCLARMSLRDAVDAATAMTGLKKSEVYTRALLLSKGDGPK